MATTPSIAMIPSGYKANKVYSLLPTDGSGDLNFSRTTNGTRVNSDSLIEEVAIGVPRLDYTDGGCPSLLLEPNSTNLITYSEDYSNAYWAKSGATVTSGFSAPSVDSPLGAFVLKSTGTGQIQAVYSGSTGVAYTASFWIKRKTGSGVVNLRSVENTNTPITITNEWARYSLPVTSTSTSIRVGLKLDTVGDEVYIFASQLEQKSYATSDIPTSGTAISRTADSASKSGISSLINSSEGVFYVEIENKFPSATTRGWNLQSSLNNGSDLISIRFSTSQSIVFYLRANGVTTINESVVNSYSGFIKIALKYKSGDSSLWINGVEVALSATAFSFSNPLSILGNFDGLGGVGHFGLKDSRVYKTVLSDSELQILTTI